MEVIPHSCLKTNYCFRKPVCSSSIFLYIQQPTFFSIKLQPKIAIIILARSFSRRQGKYLWYMCFNINITIAVVILALALQYKFFLVPKYRNSYNHFKISIKLALNQAITNCLLYWPL